MSTESPASKKTKRKKISSTLETDDSSDTDLSQSDAFVEEKNSNNRKKLKTSQQYASVTSGFTRFKKIPEALLELLHNAIEHGKLGEELLTHPISEHGDVYKLNDESLSLEIFNELSKKDKIGVTAKSLDAGEGGHGTKGEQGIGLTSAVTALLNTEQEIPYIWECVNFDGTTLTASFHDDKLRVYSTKPQSPVENGRVVIRITAPNQEMYEALKSCLKKACNELIHFRKDLDYVATTSKGRVYKLKTDGTNNNLMFVNGRKTPDTDTKRPFLFVYDLLVPKGHCGTDNNQPKNWSHFVKGILKECATGPKEAVLNHLLKHNNGCVIWENPASQKDTEKRLLNDASYRYWEILREEKADLEKRLERERKIVELQVTEAREREKAVKKLNDSLSMIDFRESDARDTSETDTFVIAEQKKIITNQKRQSEEKKKDLENAVRREEASLVATNERIKEAESKIEKAQQKAKDYGHIYSASRSADRDSTDLSDRKVNIFRPTQLIEANVRPINEPNSVAEENEVARLVKSKIRAVRSLFECLSDEKINISLEESDSSAFELVEMKCDDVPCSLHIRYPLRTGEVELGQELCQHLANFVILKRESGSLNRDQVLCTMLYQLTSGIASSGNSGEKIIKNLKGKCNFDVPANEPLHVLIPVDELSSSKGGISVFTLRLLRAFREMKIKVCSSLSLSSGRSVCIHFQRLLSISPTLPFQSLCFVHYFPTSNSPTNA